MGPAGPVGELFTGVQPSLAPLTRPVAPLSIERSHAPERCLPSHFALDRIGSRERERDNSYKRRTNGEGNAGGGGSEFRGISEREQAKHPRVDKAKKERRVNI